MKSLYGMYIAEREGKEIIESEKGFATYKIFNNGECYLQDLYVVPEFRKAHIATEMTDQVVAIARERGCNRLVGSVCFDAANPTANMNVFLKYGMQLASIHGNMIFLSKDIGDL